MTGSARRRDSFTRVWKWVALGLALVVLAGMWRWTPLSKWLNPSALARLAAPVKTSAAAPLIVVAAFIVASLLVMPVMALMVATGLVFGPLRGAAYSFVGILISAALNYGIGHWLGRAPFRRMSGPRLRRLNERLGQRGVLAIAALRLVPLAPFTVVNVAAGAAAIKLRDFMLGTLLGTAPGIVLLNAFAGQLNRTLRDAGPTNLAGLAAIAAAAVVVAMWARGRIRVTDAAHHTRRRRTSPPHLAVTDPPVLDRPLGEIVDRE
jgi:phospholipase D1/2